MNIYRPVWLTGLELAVVSEAAHRLSMTPEQLLARASGTYARLCGFYPEGVVHTRLQPMWSPREGLASSLHVVRFDPNEFLLVVSAT